jgi:hypothetical protein
MAGVARAESVLNSFARAAHINSDAKQWLMNAIDPCHDRLTKLTGYPDDNQSASVVQRVKQTFTIKAPTNPVGSGLYDVMILNTPLMNVQSLYGMVSQPGSNTTIVNNVLTYTGGNIFNSWGGLMFIAVPSGTPFTFANIFTQVVAGTGYVIANGLPVIYSQGASRVVGNAFEACNTTAELTVQGAALVFRQPVQDFEDAGVFSICNQGGGSATSYAAVSCLPIPSQPVTQAQAMLLPGSRQWKAKDGCYVVSALNSDRLPPQDLNFTLPLVYQNGSDGSGSGFIGPSTTNAGVSIPGTPVNFYGSNKNFWTNFDQSGVIFSGNSVTSTYQVTWVVDVERFPSEQQSDLVVIATPSTVYSPTCIEAYSMIIQDMPVGVPFKENGLGDWFMGAVEKVRDVVMPTIKLAAAKNPMLKSLVAVHDLVTGGNKKGQGKKGKSGKGFLAPASAAKGDPEIRAAKKAGKAYVKRINAVGLSKAALPKGVKWVATGRKSDSRIQPA